MKKIILLLIAAQYSASAIAQEPVPKSFTPDRDLSRWVLDLNALGGVSTQKLDMANTAPNYLNGVNIRTGKAAFSNGAAYGGELQLGYFFGKEKHWGLGTGLLYMRNQGNVTLDGFHAEYQSVDNNGYIFRQVVSSNGISEAVRTDNFNIPLVLKYKNRLSKSWGFTADAGALFNVSANSSYTTNASFDYEAIYKFVTTDAGVVTTVYDPSPVPENADFLITRSHFSKNNPDGSVSDYFQQKQAAGYNVGLGVAPDQQKGSSSFATGSVGFLLRPSVNYFFSDKLALNIGAYYMYQPFKNEGTAAYTMTGKPGEYNAVSNAASKAQSQSFGGNLGLRFFLGKSAAPVVSKTESTITEAPVVVKAVPAPVTQPRPAVIAEPLPVVTAPEPVEYEDTMTQILFAFNTADLRPSSYVIIDRVYDQLQKDNESYVVIDGNTDHVGTDQYNQKLSERRSDVVKAYLMKRGISDSRIEHMGNGEREPVATNATAAGRTKNRRAELLIKIRK